MLSWFFVWRLCGFGLEYFIGFSKLKYGKVIVASKDRGPGVKIPPPLIFLFFIGVAYGLDLFWPLVSVWPWFSLLACMGFIALGGGVAMLSVYQFWRAKTHIEPWRPASFLITTGIFAYSRNPIYLAFVLITVGLGFGLENLWIILCVIPASLVMYFGVVIKEERYLQEKFGDPYVAYKQKVRRWL
jgi:protein-S-isoprenylcysteine O-methyltransferase Ste14